MIIDMKKYLFIGAKEEIDRFFDRAQNQGFLEFISITGKRQIEIPLEVQNLMTAIKVLRKQPVKNPYEGGGDLAFAQQVVDQILYLRDEIDKFYEEKRLLEAEILRVRPFGDFSMDDIDYIEREGKRKVQFFCMKTAKSHKINFTDEVFYIGTEYDLDYFMTINSEPHAYPGMIEMRIDRPLGELQNQLAFVKETLHQLEAELKGFAGHIEFLHDALLEELNQHALVCAKKEISFPLENSLFAVEAWVPANKTAALYSFIDSMAVHCEQIAPEPADRIPTCMENKGVARIGEDLVKAYDIPATTDKDPSLWVFWAFVLFFAIIVSDGGYGLLYLGVAVYLKYKFPHMKSQGRRLFRLFVVLACACVLWGVTTSSFFGLNINPNGFLGRLSLVSYLTEKKAEYHLQQRDDVYQSWVAKNPHLSVATQGRELIEKAITKKGETIQYEMRTEFSRNILLEISLMIGIIHIGLGLLRYLGRHLANIGWIFFMIGGYLYFPSILNATSMVHFLGWIQKETAFKVGLQLIYGGIGLAILIAFIQKKLKGFGEIANLVQVFADVLSYLRLYALGLAGTIMAESFNGIGEFIGLAAGVVAIILGHSVNILLGMMSGVIHGLRLNFLEWYHYCFEGGGRLFKPLKKLKVE